MDAHSQPNRTFVIYASPYGYAIVYRDGGFHCDGPTHGNADANADAAPLADLHGDAHPDLGTADGDAAPAMPAAL